MRKSEHKKMILVVEDDKMHGIMLTFLFSSNEIKVEVASNGDEAIKILGERKADIIIIDLLMPIMDGFEFLEKTNKDSELKDIPKIVLSALPKKEHWERVVSLGGYDYVEKPFDTSVFVANVLRVLELSQHR